MPELWLPWVGRRQREVDTSLYPNTAQLLQKLEGTAGSLGARKKKQIKCIMT